MNRVRSSPEKTSSTTAAAATRRRPRLIAPNEISPKSQLDDGGIERTKRKIKSAPKTATASHLHTSTIKERTGNSGAVRRCRPKGETNLQSSRAEVPGRRIMRPR